MQYHLRQNDIRKDTIFVLHGTHYGWNPNDGYDSPQKHFSLIRKASFPCNHLTPWSTMPKTLRSTFLYEKVCYYYYYYYLRCRNDNKKKETIMKNIITMSKCFSTRIVGDPQFCLPQYLGNLSQSMEGILRSIDEI